MKYDPNIDIPVEIMEAARTVENWMGERGHRKWKLLGIQSREGDIPDDSSIPGFLIRVKICGDTPTMEIMGDNVDRGRARIIFETSGGIFSIPDSYPKQALFIHRSGFVEVWSE